MEGSWFWLAAAVSLAVRLTPGGDLLLAPFALFTTWAHECCHAVAALVMGGRVQSITIHLDGSGLATSVIPAGRLAQGVVTSAGYLGASLVGCLLMAAARVQRWTRAILWAVGVSMLVTLVLWVRNVFGVVLVLAWAGTLIVLARRGSSRAVRFFLGFLAVQVALNAVYDLRVLFLTTTRHSDARTMAGLFVVPAWAWASLWMALSVGMLAWTLWATRARTARVTAR